MPGKRHLLRRLGALLLLLLSGMAWAAPVKTAPVVAPPAVTAEAYILMDAENGGIYLGRNIRRGMIPASTLKILSALVVVQKGQLRRTFVIPPAAEGIEGSSMYLTAGEKMTRFDLLNGLLLCSANDAAVALAISDYGSVPAFVRQMNAMARRMHWTGTWCVDPDGLSDDNRSTALDLACMARIVLRDPVLSKIVGTRYYRIPSRIPAKILLCNHNKLLRRYQGADGVKTGYTTTAGHTLIASAKRGGRHWITVVMHSKNPYGDVEAMMDYGFTRWPGPIKKGSPGGTSKMPKNKNSSNLGGNK